jgi:4'-phosphopantetheinyl transferase
LALTSKSLLQNPLPTVQIWSVELAQPPELVARLETLLSIEERERAARMAAAPRWIVARAAVRIVLGDRLGLLPGDVEIATGPHGKPELVGATLRFNHSHSGDRALVALATSTEVGVDVERTTRRSTAIERTLTAGERSALEDCEDRHTELLRVWCRKEALAKAIGGGLGWAPEDFDTTRPEGHALVDLEVGDGYVGALAVAGEHPEVAHHRVVF